MSYSLLTWTFLIINFNTEIIRWKSVKLRKRERMCLQKKYLGPKFPNMWFSALCQGSLSVETISMDQIESV